MNAVHSETRICALLDELNGQIEGEVFFDETHRLLYSTDASIFQQVPLGVARPRHVGDCVTLVRFARKYGIGLIPRGAGTSLAGQCVGSGLVVDLSRTMNRILTLDFQRRTVTVQPGVVLDHINEVARPHGLMFGAETSTSNRCTIGGMVGNNSAGAHSIVLGTTRDHVLSATALLSDDSQASFSPLSDGELDQKLAMQTLEGRIYRTLVDLVRRHRAVILRRYPSSAVQRRNAGYALDYLARSRPFDPDGPEFNLAPFLCGSEGTLCLVTEVTLRLIDRPKSNLLLCAHFDSVDEALRGTLIALEHSPAAVELLDGNILSAAAQNLEQQRNCFWIEGEPSGVLAVEFYGDSALSLDERMQELIAHLRANRLGYSFPVLAPPDIDRVWALRKVGLGLLTGRSGDTRSVTITEDASVAPADLPAYVEQMRSVMEQHGTTCVYYGHASVGLLHLRPMLNLRTAQGVSALKEIADEAAEIVSRFGGSLSGEHGDGRLRGPYLERVLGTEVHELLKGVKQAFDPMNLFNPGKIVDSPPIDSDLRISPEIPVVPCETFFDWTSDGGLLRALERCSGAAVCLRSVGRGTMCPSYLATGEELHATRGRANLFRQLLLLEGPQRALTHPELHRALELCLSCKACKAECPSSVDLARLKAEFLQHYYDRHGTPLNVLVFGHFDRLARLARLAPRWVSKLLNTTLVKRMLGIDPRRRIPAFAIMTFEDWARNHVPHANAGMLGEVVLFNDEFTGHCEPEVTIAAVELLEAAGYSIALPEGLSSARAQLSGGLLRAARERVEHAVETLHAYARDSVPIVGLEPSALLTFRDEAPHLVQGADLKRKAREVSDVALLFEEFVVSRGRQGELGRVRLRMQGEKHILFHGHCHQKALVGSDPLRGALSSIDGVSVSEIPSGCCGMAGSFGYEEYEMSMAIGEQVLFPAVRRADPETILVAPGISCRHQIQEGTGRVVLHPAQVLRGAMEP